MARFYRLDETGQNARYPFGDRLMCVSPVVDLERPQSILVFSLLPSFYYEHVFKVQSFVQILLPEKRRSIWFFKEGYAQTHSL